MPDPAVLAMAARIDWEPWPESGYPAVFPAAIEVELTDGTTETLRIDDVDGSARRPWDAARVIGKFLDNCARVGVESTAAEKFSDALIGAAHPDLSALRSLVGATG
ncbi:hypothetical protein [Amycolatopsis taiwanensis]|nr:hypothetical protein [Amycolatopsis taiwanensis]